MRALRATMRSAIAEAAANRASLGAQMAVMAINDLVWVIFWVLFFHRVGSLHGQRRTGHTCIRFKLVIAQPRRTACDSTRSARVSRLRVWGRLVPSRIGAPRRHNAGVSDGAPAACIGG